MNIMSQMSQWSQASDVPTSKERPSLESMATSIEESQEPKTNNDINRSNLTTSEVSSLTEITEYDTRNNSVVLASVLPSYMGSRIHQASPAPLPPQVTPETAGFTRMWLNKNSRYSEERTIKLLLKGVPTNMRDYAEHLYKVSCLLYDGDLSHEQTNRLEWKYVSLTACVDQFSLASDPAKSQLYLVVERCFDVFIKMAMNLRNMQVATHTIRFLTTVVMLLNYWEIYNLLRRRPAIYQFLTLIDFDLHECYARFVTEYKNYTYKQERLEEELLLKAAAAEEGRRKRKRHSSFSDSSSGKASEAENGSFEAQELVDDSNTATKATGTRTSVISAKAGTGIGSLPSRDKSSPGNKKKARVASKLGNHRLVQRAEFKLAPSTRSSNYDPDVVHECQLPSPEDCNKVCLRRFSRKYELIRHQETVHLKKKKLFKCYVCVKQDPSIGPRIFTRHDTLAKHIRVNHRISGKEAKAEVAYSKKHAEFVEEGDITVHVGRRKTKVDFELRAHMDKKGGTREEPNGSIIFDEIDDSAPDSIHSGDEGLY